MVLNIWFYLWIDTTRIQDLVVPWRSHKWESCYWPPCCSWLLCSLRWFGEELRRGNNHRYPQSPYIDPPGIHTEKYIHHRCLHNHQSHSSFHSSCRTHISEGECLACFEESHGSYQDLSDTIAWPRLVLSRSSFGIVRNCNPWCCAPWCPECRYLL